MAAFAEALVLLLALAMVPLIALAALTHVPFNRPVAVALHRRRPPHPVPDPPRPIEQVAHDLRRISRLYHQPGMRFAQYEGRRQAFDKILAEAADAVRIDQLLGVLPPGLELDAERARVEAALVEAGVLPHPAEPG